MEAALGPCTAMSEVSIFSNFVSKAFVALNFPIISGHHFRFGFFGIANNGTYLVRIPKSWSSIEAFETM